jgi:hypothetical protein
MSSSSLLRIEAIRAQAALAGIVLTPSPFSRYHRAQYFTVESLSTFDSQVFTIPLCL